MYDLPDNAILYASDRHGIYIPQYFAESVNRDRLSGVPDSDLDALALGPDSCDYYWDIWHDVECNAIVTDSDGTTFSLYQDGDLWLVPTDWTPKCD